MAELLIYNAFRLAAFTLNYLSPSIVADIILHPFDFATVLLQIGFNSEGLKAGRSTFVSAIAQCALFTFYIPYLLTSTQGIQFLGSPHPSMFHYVSYIYNKEGFLGCYRGLLPKICERIVMMYVNETIKQSITKVPIEEEQTDTVQERQDEKLMFCLVNNLCSQFFAVVASHPFHVIMIYSFSEFMQQKKSSMFTLAQRIYEDDGCYGFFIGLAPRILGELFSMTFSILYTELINKQTSEPEENSNSQPTTSNNTSMAVNYLPDLSRFNVFKSRTKDVSICVKRTGLNNPARTRNTAQYLVFFNRLIENLTHNQQFKEVRKRVEPFGVRWSNIRNRRLRLILQYLPLTSKVFYYMMIRDFISKKISYPFFLVCHCMIVLDTGWDKLSLLQYLRPLIKLIHLLIPKQKRY